MNELAVEICKRLGIDTKGKTSGGFLTKCWAHKENDASLSISLDKGVYHCFGCGISGTLASHYYEVKKRSIYNELGIDAPVSVSLEREVSLDEIPIVDLAFNGNTTRSIDSVKSGEAWLKKRGFTCEHLKNFRAEYCFEGKTFKYSEPSDKDAFIYVYDRIIFPIYEKGCILSYELRDTKGEHYYRRKLLAKGLNPKKYPYKKVLYPRYSSTNTVYDIDRLDKSKTLYLVEGLMDVISLRTHPLFKNCSCLFRNTPSERQVYLLKDFDIVYIVNNDVPGLTGCKKLMERIPGSGFLCLPKSVKDVNDILQGKDSRIPSLDNLVNKWGWLKKIRRDLSALNAQIENLGG